MNAKEWQLKPLRRENKDLLQQKSTRERERMASETPEEREGRLQRMSTNRHERLAGETPEKREGRLQRMSTNRHERLAGETPEKREGRLQRMSTNQHKRLAAETPEERERLQPLPRCITRRILYHIETVNYHSILCKIILVQHVTYSGRMCKFSAKLHNRSSAVCLMKYVHSDVMCQ